MAPIFRWQRDANWHPGPWNAHVKDKLEDRLHALVCAGRLPLEQAQREIAADWIAAYEKYVGPVVAGR